MTLHEFKIGVATVDYILSWGAKIEKFDSRRPNILKFGSTQDTIYAIDDEIKYYDLDENYIFGGYLQKLTDKDGIQFFEVADYSIKASQVKVNEVYENDTIEDILADLISNYTDWTITTNVTTGITVSKIIFKDQWLVDALNKLFELFNGAMKVNKNKEVVFFVNDTVSSGMDLLQGRDYLDGGWGTDIEPKAEHVVVKGAFVQQRTTETLSGTGTVFYTTFKPENIEITGLQQTTDSIDGDYVVDVENKKITFDTSKTNPVVSYTYTSQIRVDIGDPDGKTIELEKKWIQDRTEARRIGREYMAKFSDGAQYSSWIKSTDALDSYNPGETIFVGDDINSKTGTYTINQVSLELPNKMKITIGESETDMFDQQKETIERIKQLEEQNNNSEFITKDDYLINNISVSVTTQITKLQGIINDGEILWASETTLDTDGDLISDTGLDADYALAYDDSAIPAGNIIDYLNP